jgi:hypothetical protein
MTTCRRLTISSAVFLLKPGRRRAIRLQEARRQCVHCWRVSQVVDAIRGGDRLEPWNASRGSESPPWSSASRCLSRGYKCAKPRLRPKHQWIQSVTQGNSVNRGTTSSLWLTNLQTHPYWWTCSPRLAMSPSCGSHRDKPSRKAAFSYIHMEEDRDKLASMTRVRAGRPGPY